MSFKQIVNVKEAPEECWEDLQGMMELEDIYGRRILPADWKKLKRKFGNHPIDVLKKNLIPFDEAIEQSVDEAIEPGPTIEDVIETAKDADSDMDDCVLMSGLQGALAAVEEQKAVKVEQVEEQAEPDEIEEAKEPEPEQVEQNEEGTGAASSTTRKDTRVRPGRKRRELNV